MKANVPFLDLESQLEPLRGDLRAAFERVLQHKGFCLGPEVEAFEADLKAFTGQPFALGVNSGTSALHLAALALGLGPGDEVLLPAMSFASTAWAVSYVGATPVFVDIDPVTCNLDPEQVERGITTRTRAIIAVHLYGQVAAMPELRKICDREDLILIEDGAQALGATLGDRAVGYWGDATCFSFYPGKNLGALGEGGALITRDESLYEKAFALRNHGCLTDRYRHDLVGYNYRMEGVQAAALRVKLPHLPSWIGRRRTNAHRYAALLCDLNVRLPEEGRGSAGAWHLYVLRFAGRDALMERLKAKGIGVGLHYPIPLHLQPCYADLGYSRGSCPVAEELGDQCLSLPMFPELSEDQQGRVAEALRNSLEECR